MSAIQTKPTASSASTGSPTPDSSELRFDLMVAIRTNQPELAFRLIDQGADLSARFDGDATPLCSAAVFGRSSICAALIKAGSDIHVRADRRLQPLHLAAETDESRDSARTCEVLIAMGADFSATAGDLRRQPLHFAAAKGNAMACAVLVMASAPLEDADEDGNTPLACAVKAGHVGAARVLLRAGANPDWWPNPERTRSLVRHAEFTDDFPMLWTLLSYGADHASDLTANFKHLTELDCAAYAFDVERFSELLQKAGPKGIERLGPLREHAQESLDVAADQLIAVMDAAVARAAIQGVIATSRKRSQP